MPEPTIDEMLAWLDKATTGQGRDRITSSENPIREAIRTILVEYNKEGVSLITEKEVSLYQHEAIRAFVERVELSDLDWQEAILTELAAMEEGPKKTATTF